MPPPKKEGDKETPTVTLRGRQLQIVRVVAQEMGVDLPEAIRAILERWITSQEGMQVLREAYRLDIQGPEAKVLPLKRESNGSGDRR